MNWTQNKYQGIKQIQHTCLSTCFLCSSISYMHLILNSVTSTVLDRKYLIKIAFLMQKNGIQFQRFFNNSFHMIENIPNQHIIWKLHLGAIRIYILYVCFFINWKRYSKNGEISPSFLSRTIEVTEMIRVHIYDIELHKKQVLRQVCWICLMPWYLFCVQFTRTRCFKTNYIHLCTF